MSPRSLSLLLAGGRVEGVLPEGAPERESPEVLREGVPPEGSSGGGLRVTPFSTVLRISVKAAVRDHANVRHAKLIGSLAPGTRVLVLEEQILRGARDMWVSSTGVTFPATSRIRVHVLDDGDGATGSMTSYPGSMRARLWISNKPSIVTFWVRHSDASAISCVFSKLMPN